MTLKRFLLRWLFTIRAEWPLRCVSGLGFGVAFAASQLLLDMEPLDHFGHPKPSLPFQDAIHRLPIAFAFMFVLFVVAPWRWEKLFARPAAAPILDQPRSHCPRCAEGITFDRIMWSTSFACPNCKGEIEVPAWVRSLLRWTSLVVAGVLAYAIGLRNWVLLPVILVGHLVVSMWIVSVVRVCGVQVPLRSHGPDDFIRLRPRPGSGS